MQPSYLRAKIACYTANISMAIVTNFPPLLFLTFRHLYGISYSLLGTLVLINFVTQLTIDLIFSLFSHKFNIPLMLRVMPLLAVVGFVLFSLAPILFPTAVYLGLVIGTVIFSVSSGLAEVLVSPTIAAIPAENPDREMSKLHSIYAWGAVGIILFSTLFLLAFGGERWQLLTVILAAVPLFSAILFFRAEIPPMQTPERTTGALRFLRQGGVWLCIFGIFLGGAAECTMSQWVSGYLERALGISKVWGDVFGVAMFSVALGMGRTLYARIGKRITRVLLWGAVGAAVCYLTATLAPLPILGLLGCAFTGFCVSMLWPGSLIVASDRYPTAGVMIFALMAAGGDLGASFGPQMVGIVTDLALTSPRLLSLASRLAIAPEQLGMKLGLLIATLFSLIAIPVYLHFAKWARDKKTETTEM